MKIIRRKLKGLSLLEVMVSIGIFSLMMVTVASIFSSSMMSARTNTAIEHDLENAQFVMNDMAKQLRTSTVVNPTGNPAADSAGIRFYDYSQGQCIQYQATTVDDGARHVINRTAATTTRTGCAAGTSLSALTTVTTGDVIPTFRIVTSALDAVTPANSRVGRVTMMFAVKEKSTAPRSVTIQTSVSLRDYVESGVIQ